MAKTGNREACKILAKQLVQLRKQKNRTYAVSSKVTSMSTQTKVMNSQMKMAGAMSTTAKVRPLILPMDLHYSWFSYSIAQHKTLQHSQFSPPIPPPHDNGSVLFTRSPMCSREVLEKQNPLCSKALQKNP